MGNKRNSELENFNLDSKTRRLLEEVGWLNFVMQYEGFQPEMVMEFVTNFNVNVTRVRGEIIKVTLEIISEISRIPNEGKPVNKGQVKFEKLVAAFHHEPKRRPEIQTHKGDHRGIACNSLDKPWRTIASCFMKFFTCNGQYGTILGPGMQFLIHLRYGQTNPSVRINFPTFLFQKISSMILRVKARGESSLKYQGLIHLIIKYHFLKK